MERSPFRGKIIAISVGIVSSLVILEIFLRVVDIKEVWGFARQLGGERLTDCLSKDQYLNHKLVPNCKGKIKTGEYEIDLTTNSMGMRDNEVSSKGDIKRVLFLGDSYTEGWGVNINDRFDKKLSIPGVELVNAGTRSYSPALELKYLLREEDNIKPDLVVLLLDMSDLHDDYYYGGWDLHYDLQKKVLGYTANDVEEWPPYSLKSSLFDISKLTSTIYRGLGSIRLDKEHKLTRTNLGWDINLFSRAQSWEGYDKAWNLTLSNLYLIDSYLKSKGVKFAVAVVPRGNYVSALEWDKGRETFGAKRGEITDPAPYRIISEGLMERKIDEIDLLSTFKEKSSGNLFYPFDGHWTVDGNNVAAEAIGKYISSYFNK